MPARTMPARTMRRRNELLAAATLSAAMLVGAAAAEAADRTVKPRHRHAHVHRVVKVRHFDCVDDRAPIKHLKYAIRCAVVSEVPPPRRWWW